MPNHFSSQRLGRLGLGEQGRKRLAGAIIEACDVTFKNFVKAQRKLKYSKALEQLERSRGNNTKQNDYYGREQVVHYRNFLFGMSPQGGKFSRGISFF